MANEASPAEVEEIKKKAKDKIEATHPNFRELFPDERAFITNMYWETLKHGYSRIEITPKSANRRSTVILKSQNGERFSVSWSQLSDSENGVTLEVVDLDKKDPRIIQFVENETGDKVKVKYWDYAQSKTPLPEKGEKEMITQVLKAKFDSDSTTIYRSRENEAAKKTLKENATIHFGSAAEFKFPGPHPLSTV